MTRVRGAFALALALLVLVGCSGNDPERDALLERIEPWTTEETRFIVQRGNPRETGSIDRLDDLGEFIDVAPVARVWPAALPPGTTLTQASLLFAPRSPVSLRVSFVGDDGGPSFVWNVFDIESGGTTTGSSDHLVATQNGVVILEEPSIEFARWSVHARGCGRTLIGFVLTESALTADETMDAAGSINDCDD